MMQELLIHWLPLSLSSAALLGLFVVLVAVLRSREEQGKLFTVLEQLNTGRALVEQQNEQLQTLAEQLLVCQQQFQQQQAVVVELMERSNALEQFFQQQVQLLQKEQNIFAQRLRQQQESIQEVAEQEPESKFYQRAARLVQQGATLDEVMLACELPRAEAELLYTLYKK